MESLALQPSCNATSNGNPDSAAPGNPVRELPRELRRPRPLLLDLPERLLRRARRHRQDAVRRDEPECLDAAIDPADVDAKNPGTQLACTVTRYGRRRHADAAQTVIPACAMTDATHPAPDGVRPCWWVASDPVACPAPDSGLELQIERGQAPPPSGDVIELECVAASDSSIGVAAPG